MQPRIHIVVGHYGSGKTEFAVNYAIKLKQDFERVYIVDLDIVNPYFRTNDVKNQLESFGVSVIVSPYAGTNVDVPSLPSDIYKVFADTSSAVVFDVGGDDDGAIALGRYKQYFEQEPYELLFTINTYRPLTENADLILEMMQDIEQASRLTITGLINNSNLAHFTTIDEVLKGQAVTEEVSKKSGVPCQYISGTKEVIEKLPEELSDKAFPITRYLELFFNQ